MLWHAALGVDQRLAYDEVSPAMKLSSTGTGWCEGRSPADLKRSLLSTRLTESSGEILHVEFCTMQQIHGKCGPSCFMKHVSFQLESVRPDRRGSIRGVRMDMSILDACHGDCLSLTSISQV
jgi:hypothetical protein